MVQSRCLIPRTVVYLAIVLGKKWWLTKQTLKMVKPLPLPILRTCCLDLTRASSLSSRNLVDECPALFVLTPVCNSLCSPDFLRQHLFFGLVIGCTQFLFHVLYTLPTFLRRVRVELFFGGSQMFSYYTYSGVY